MLFLLTFCLAYTPSFIKKNSAESVIPILTASSKNQPNNTAIFLCFILLICCNGPHISAYWLISNPLNQIFLGADYYLMSIDDIYENNLFKSLFWRDITAGNSLWTGLTFTKEVKDQNGYRTANISS